MIGEKERKVKELIDLHLEKVAACLGCFRGCLEAFLRQNIQKAEQIHENCDYAETEADIIRRKIADSLFTGAFLPLARKDVYMLSETIDEIANTAERASDTIVFQGPDVPVDYTDDLLQIAASTCEAFAIFQEAASNFMPDESFHDQEHLDTIRQKISTVIEIESRIDQEEEKLIRKFFASSLPLAQKLQLEILLRRITAISDKIEDAADRLNVLLIGEKL